MATRFSASDARKEAQIVKKSIDQDTRKKTKEHAAIKSGWTLQRKKIISAAIEGNIELSNLNKIYLYRDLLSLGLKVTRCEFNNALFHNKAEEDKLRESTLDSFDEFINKSQDELTPYYKNSNDFFTKNHEELLDSINTNDTFQGDLIYFIDVPKNIREKYREYIMDINENINNYWEFKKSIKLEKSNQNLINEYFYTIKDSNQSILNNVKDNCYFKISWSNINYLNCLKNPIFTGPGLSWLSSKQGQKIIEKIFTSLKESAKLGIMNLELNFEFSNNEGWYLKTNNGKIHSCLPEDLIGIVEMEKFKVRKLVSNEQLCSILVNW